MPVQSVKELTVCLKGHALAMQVFNLTPAPRSLLPVSSKKRAMNSGGSLR